MRYNTQPPSESVADRGFGFRSIHELPELAADQHASMTIRMATDYWMFCLAGVLDQRLFADFQADCCLIIRRRPFEERLLRAATLQLRNVDAYFGRVLYVDSLGARPARVRVTRSIPIHMTKLFRYANQREIRFALLSRRFQEQLTPGLSGSSPFPTSRSSCRFPTTTRLGSSPHVTSPSAFDGAGHARRGARAVVLRTDPRTESRPLRPPILIVGATRAPQLAPALSLRKATCTQPTCRPKPPLHSTTNHLVARLRRAARASSSSNAPGTRFFITPCSRSTHDVPEAFISWQSPRRGNLATPSRIGSTSCRRKKLRYASSPLACAQPPDSTRDLSASAPTCSSSSQGILKPSIGCSTIIRWTRTTNVAISGKVVEYFSKFESFDRKVRLPNHPLSAATTGEANTLSPRWHP